MPTISTQNHTVTNHSYALNVVDLITEKIAKKGKYKQNAHYAVAIILPTTKVTNMTIT